MLIKIDDSVIDYLKQNQSTLNESSSEIIALNNLANAFREGYHILTGSLEVLEYLNKLLILDNLSRRTYNNMISKFAFSGVYEEEFKSYVLVHAKQSNINKIISDDKNIYQVPLTYFNRLHRLNPTSLVAEDLSDCEFYERLGKKYISENIKTLNVLLKFDYENGGGNNTYKKFEYKIQKECFVLSIADNDKSFPTDTSGNTLLELKAIYDLYRDKSIVELVELEVREKENLIPPSLYSMCSHVPFKKSMEQLLEIELLASQQSKLKYLDIKDGLRVKKFKRNEKFKEYYSDLFNVSNLIAYSYEEIEGMDDDTILVGGIGSKIHDFSREILDDGLERVFATKKVDSNVPPQVLSKIEKDIEKKSNIFRCLPDYLVHEWDRLCKIIISWGCCGSHQAT